MMIHLTQLDWGGEDIMADLQTSGYCAAEMSNSAVPQAASLAWCSRLCEFYQRLLEQHGPEVTTPGRQAARDAASVFQEILTGWDIR